MGEGEVGSTYVTKFFFHIAYSPFSLPFKESRPFLVYRDLSIYHRRMCSAWFDVEGRIHERGWKKN